MSSRNDSWDRVDGSGRRVKLAGGGALDVMSSDGEDSIDLMVRCHTLFHPALLLYQPPGLSALLNAKAATRSRELRMQLPVLHPALRAPAWA